MYYSSHMHIHGNLFPVKRNMLYFQVSRYHSAKVHYISDDEVKFIRTKYKMV